MPAQRQTNMHSLTAHLCEVRDSDGTLYPAIAVDPGVSVDWPQPIAGFAGWVTPVPEGFEVADAEVGSAGPESASVADPAPKSRTKASKASDTPEVTG